MFPIHYAAGGGDKKALKGILSSLPLRQDPVECVLGSRRLCWRVGVDQVDEVKRTALMHAVHGNHFDCVTLLVEAGANISAVAAGERERERERERDFTPPLHVPVLQMAAPHCTTLPTQVAHK